MPKKTDTTTSGYISALLQPRAECTADRRSWSIPVFGVWVPFLENATQINPAPGGGAEFGRPPPGGGLGWAGLPKVQGIPTRLPA